MSKSYKAQQLPSRVHWVQSIYRLTAKGVLFLLSVSAPAGFAADTAVKPAQASAATVLAVSTGVPAVVAASATTPPVTAGTSAKAAPVVRVLLSPAGETTLASPVGGIVKALNVELGSSFAAGQVLISLDCEEPTAKLNMAHAELDASVEQHEAKLRMQGLGQASDVEVALAASTVAKNRAQVALQKSQVGQCSLKAPWAGRVSRVNVRNYMAVTPGNGLLDLVKSGGLKLRLNVPSVWMAWMKPGVDFQIQVDETTKKYPAKVIRVNSRVDAVSQTIELEANLSGQYPELLPGMSGTATFSQASN